MTTTKLLAASAACLILAGAAAAQTGKPRWEVGVGGFGTYSAAYPGSDESDFGGFPLAYFSYRGENFSILPDGLFGIDLEGPAFDFGASFDFNGGVDSEDRLGLGDTEPLAQFGPDVKVALTRSRESRLVLGVAARAAYLFDDSPFVEGGFVGFVIEPELAYRFALTDQARMQLSISAQFSTDDDYGEIFYGTPLYRGQSGYIGTDIKVRYVNDISDRFRLIAEVKATSLSGSANEDSPLLRDDWNFGARLGFTYVIWQSEARAGR